MTLTTKCGTRYDCERPMIGKYGVTFICSGCWNFVPWDEVLEIRVGDALILTPVSG